MEVTFPSDKLFSLRWLRSWIYIILGSFSLAMAFVLFLTPYNIVPGGVYGMGIILHSVFPSIQVGTFGFILDIPLLIIALRLFGNHLGSRTIVAAILTPLFMNGLTYFIGEDPTTMLSGSINLSNDVLLSSIFGGLFAGIGLGLIVRNRATSGGTDIISMIVSKYTKMPFAKALLIVDSAVVLVGLIVFKDWRIPLYSLITIYVSSKIIDYIIDGGGSNKLLFIISDKHDQMRELITEKLERGGTYIKSAGMYTMKDKEMIFVVVNRTEVSIIRDYIKQIDPFAFTVIVNAHEIYGEGFKSIK